jgi:hypothetical protein
MDLFSSLPLLTGQPAPFTGQWMNAASSRDSLFTVFGSGNGSVALQYKNAFGFPEPNLGVPFYTFTGVTTGYMTPAFSTSPFNEIRAIASGVGNFWASATIQN